MVDKEDTEDIGVLVSSNIESVKVQSFVSVDAGEVLDGQQF